MRVLSAILLLGNLRYLPRPLGSVTSLDMQSDTNGGGVCTMLSAEAPAIAELLGISPASLFRALCVRTHQTKGQTLQTYSSAQGVHI